MVFGNQIWHQDSDGIGGVAEPNDSFGAALAAGDFNNDGFEDLAIGVREDVRGKEDVGVVNVIYGGPGGLAAVGNQVWGQDSVGIGGGGEGGDLFGDALATGDFNSDHFDDLAVGVPGEDSAAGAVNVLLGGPDGLSALGNQIWAQGSDGIAGEAKGGDFFGQALAAGYFNSDGFEDLAIGVPGEMAKAGAVNVLYGAANAGPIQFSAEGIVSAASFLPGAAPASIMSLFGVNLAAATEVASEVPLPTSLAGTTVRVTAEPRVGQVNQILRGTLAPLFFASPGQINFLMPPVRLGPARVTVTTADGNSSSARIEIERVAPALFTADSSGSGVAAAQFIKIAADGTRTQGLIFDPQYARCCSHRPRLGPGPGFSCTLWHGDSWLYLRGHREGPRSRGARVGCGSPRPVRGSRSGQHRAFAWEPPRGHSVGHCPHRGRPADQPGLFPPVFYLFLLKPGPLLPPRPGPTPGPVALDVKPDPSRRALEIQPQKPRFAGRAK